MQRILAKVRLIARRILTVAAEGGDAVLVQTKFRATSAGVTFSAGPSQSCVVRVEAWFVIGARPTCAHAPSEKHVRQSAKLTKPILPMLNTQNVLLCDQGGKLPA
jgi:hypothetical protein